LDNENIVYTFSTFPAEAFVNSSFTHCSILEIQFQQKQVKRNLKEMFNLKSCVFILLSSINKFNYIYYD